MADYVKNHVASASYLRLFADPRGKIQVRGVAAPWSGLRDPSSIGYRKRLWGSDVATREWAEQRSQFYEAEAKQALETLPATWPLPVTSEKRQAILRLMALHIVRSPYHLAETRRRMTALVAQEVANHPRLHRRLLRETALSDRFVAETVLNLVPKMATLLGHLHWSVLHTERPILATCDRPLIAMPFLAPHARIPAKHRFDNVPDNLEFRFTIGPRNALLMSWHPRPDEPKILEIDHQTATNLNAAVLGHADAEVYWLPGTSPPFIHIPERIPSSRPISTRLWTGYTVRSARRSPRYRAMREAMSDLVENDIENEIRMIEVTEKAA